MNNMSQKEIEKALSEMKPSDRMAPADSFWSDFRARAGSQDAEVTLSSQRRLMRIPTAPRWALAAACVMIAVAVASIRFLTPAGIELASSVGSWEVLAPHSAVVIVNDGPTQSTIMWIVDMTTDNTNGGTS